MLEKHGQDYLEEDPNLENDEDERLLNPGKFEGVPKTDKKKDEPPEGSPRWNKVYGRMKDAERNFENAQKEMESLKEAVKSFKEHNEKLAKSIDGLAQKKDEDKSKEKDVEFDKTVNTLEEEIEAAVEAEDFKTASKLQNKLTRMLITSVKPAKVEIPDFKKVLQEFKEDLEKGSSKKEADVTFKAWLKNNKWYEEDPIMRGAADAYGETVMKKGKSYEEMLEEVGKEIPKRFGTKRETSKFSAVEGATPAKKSYSDDSTPTEEDIKVAKMFDIKIEDYMKQKVFAAKGAA